MRGKSRVSDKDIKEMMREIRLALLEADVNYQLVKELGKDISERCLGSDVLKSLTPGQQVVKIVHEALIEMLGSTESKLAVDPSGFTVIMIYGLQGSGKTTTSAKLAKFLAASGKKPMLCSVDVHRPAAQEQLAILAKEVEVPCYIDPSEPEATVIAKAAVERAKYLMKDTLIVDTAGRMTIDQDLMDELQAIQQVVKPSERLLIVDAMIGQEAVNIAKAFDEQIGLDGFIMTKLDGDARGGAALSIRKVTGKPVKMIGTGEKMDAFESFHPDRMASRILGMGDVLSLIEKAEQAFDHEQAERTFQKLKSQRFDMQDMLEQFEQMQKMGSMKDLLGMVPGLSGKVSAEQIDDSAIDRSMAIIRSMTHHERRQVKCLDASRRRRIAQGAGVEVFEVNRVVKQFNEMQKMMKHMGGMSKGKRRRFGKMPGKGWPF